MVFQIQPLNPVALKLGNFPIHWYGIIIGFGALIGYIIANREAVRLGIKKDTLADLLLFAFPIAILSARLYYVIFEWERYKDNLGSVFAIWQGGLAIHGGLIGALITGYFFTKKRKLSFWKLADIVAPSILLAQAIGRWGNFMNQEAHGGIVSLQFLEKLHLPQFIINQMYIKGEYYHPTFLYESCWSLIGVIILLLLRKVNLRRGELFLTYVMWYSFGRFFIEGMRTDSLYIIANLRTAQVVSLVSFLLALALIIYRRKTDMSGARYADVDAAPKTKKKKHKKG